MTTIAYNWYVVLKSSIHSSPHVTRVQVAVSAQVKSKAPVWWQVSCTNHLRNNTVPDDILKIFCLVVLAIYFIKIQAQREDSFFKIETKVMEKHNSDA